MLAAWKLRQAWCLGCSERGLAGPLGRVGLGRAEGGWTLRVIEYAPWAPEAMPGLHFNADCEGWGMHCTPSRP